MALINFSSSVARMALAAALLLPSFGNAQKTGRTLEIVPKLAPPSRALHKAPSAAQTAYLFVYFEDETHSVYFATSPDGYTFTDVNNGEPVLLGQDIATQKGVRDPYITRGPDGAFYLALTDLDIDGKRKGYRTTQWERPEGEFGWGNNQDLIFMKSYDLLHWTLSRVFIDKLFPRFGPTGCAWAPEMIFDPAVGKMMVYFTTRLGAGPNFLIYSYADAAFTTLQTEPKHLFDYPKPSVNVIDGDITKVGDTYHLFYVAHDKPGNIRHASSRFINRGYNYEPDKVDPESAGDEAPNLWQRHGTATYVLMYDIFGIKPHNMGFSETSDFVHYKDIGRMNEGSSPMKGTNFTGPKHGAVMSVTPAEVERLRSYFVAQTSSAP